MRGHREPRQDISQVPKVVVSLPLNTLPGQFQRQQQEPWNTNREPQPTPPESVRITLTWRDAVGGEGVHQAHWCPAGGACRQGDRPVRGAEQDMVEGVIGPHQLPVAHGHLPVIRDGHHSREVAGGVQLHHIVEDVCLAGGQVGGRQKSTRTWPRPTLLQVLLKPVEVGTCMNGDIMCYSMAWSACSIPASPRWDPRGAGCQSPVRRLFRGG